MTNPITLPQPVEEFGRHPMQAKPGNLFLMDFLVVPWGLSPYPNQTLQLSMQVVVKKPFEGMFPLDMEFGKLRMQARPGPVLVSTKADSFLDFAFILPIQM
jgi:hypothetical protein